MSPEQVIGVALARLAADLIDGFVTKEEAHKRVRDILPDEGASERAAARLEKLAEVDDPGDAS